ncbi:alkene reductase [Burkholderia oklahomensis]|uniref:Oxidoreductase, FMN-binding protein n=1 Tax=Burkholderia oklahomensis TaxID=342113 RepID=A0AAI8BD86_9BURK|nr:alkene reductase [Burkholderia oklahomensis]AIO70028.1 oxidoreductase, FMN-binding protein [Burkholderia oklahomensis]AOI38606.1 alkene reductase [Burkholderia oklahomensis EO147]KUY48271.1 alkene reductase [Burkholderia oklahomensis EO147]QPS41042.1 alkene reductase [Burkholderia oklahomensis]
MTNDDPLFEPLQLGGLILPNRIVMPPMTRSRATQPGDEANALMAAYYAQRASAGLIIGEGAYVAPLAKGYAWTPGIHTPAQIAGWRKVTDAVHAAGGRMFAQLWHVGRLSHTSLLGGAQPVSSSALQAEGVSVFVAGDGGAPGFVQASTPRALTLGEIPEIVRQFRDAARNAIEAGFDGVELHGANGYLVNQFIDSNANTRTDAYGGSLENRLRFLGDVARALIEGTGDAARVGIRLAPLTTLNGCVDADPETTYTAAVKLLDEIGVGYIHIAEADWDDAPHMPASFKQRLRAAYRGVMIYAGKYTAERAREAIVEGWADLIAFGRPFVANPDLPARIRRNAPWNAHRRETLFGGDARGLTDYPTLADEAAMPVAERVE